MAVVVRERMYDTLTFLGFSYVALNPGDYRTGSMIETFARG